MRERLSICLLITAITVCGGCATRDPAADIPVRPLQQGPEAAVLADDSQQSAGDILLDDVLARLPAVPVAISGRVWTKKKRGRDKTKLKIKAYLFIAGQSAEANYFIMDETNGILEELAISRRAGRQTSFTYTKGEPPVKAELSDLSETIQGTDITWLDLSLSFLWWRDSRIVASGKAKGRASYVLDVLSPKDEPGELRNLRLWIDQEHHMLLKAQEYDAEGVPKRRLSVKSFKKINDEWMIKDIEVENLDTETKTILRIEDLEAVDVRSQRLD